MTVRAETHSRGRLASATLAIAMLGGCGGSVAESIDLEPCVRIDESGRIILRAEDVAYDAPCIAVQAGTPFTIQLRSFDDTDHNVAIYESSAKATTYLMGDSVFFGEFLDYPVPALAEDEYYFECTIHPEMNGPLYAVASE